MSECPMISAIVNRSRPRSPILVAAVRQIVKPQVLNFRILTQREPERNPAESNATIRSREKDTGSFAIYSGSLSRDSFSSPTILSCDERSRCEIAGGVQHRGEEVRNGVDGDQNPDSLGWQAEGEEEWREHDERAARDARDGECEEDRGEGDRGQAPEVQRDAVEPADEERADGPWHRRGDLERGDCEREDEAGHFLRQ